MDLQQYRKLRELTSGVEEEVVEDLLEEHFEKLSPFSTDENFEAKVYLADFFSRKKDKPFYRNLERVYNNNLEEKEIKKIISSCLTYLFIEKEDGNEIAEQSVDYLIELLEKIRNNTYTCKEVVKELKECYEFAP